MNRAKLRIALSKGRILEQVLPLLAGIGIEVADQGRSSRRLVTPTTSPDVEFIIIRAKDVPTFVDYGAADLGVAGRDVLMEHGGSAHWSTLRAKWSIS